MASATSVCGQRCKKHIYIFLYFLLLRNKWGEKITKLKQRCSISGFFYGSQLPLAIVCCGWNALVQIAPVFSDLTKASSSINALCEVMNDRESAADDEATCVWLDSSSSAEDALFLFALLPILRGPKTTFIIQKKYQISAIFKCRSLWFSVSPLMLMGNNWNTLQHICRDENT